MYSFEEIKKREKELLGTSYPAEIDTIRENIFNYRKYDGEMNFYYSFGGAVCGPIYTFLCEWALQIAQKESIKLILPLMREGELYSKILECMIGYTGQSVKIIPIWISRHSSYTAMCYDKFDKEFFQEICGAVREMTIQEKLNILGLGNEDSLLEGIEDTDLLTYSIGKKALDETYDRIINYNLDKKINTYITKYKQLIEEYLIQQGVTEDFLTLDFGTTGRLPQAIDNCTSDELKKIHLFLYANADASKRLKKGHDIRFCFSYQDKYHICGGIGAHLYETFTMGNLEYGTALGYKKDANGCIKVMHDVVRFDEEVRKTITIMQEGVMDFCENYIKLRLNIDGELKQSLFKAGVNSFLRFVEFPFYEEAEKIGKLRYEESIFKKTGRFICEIDNKKSFIEKFPLNELYVDKRVQWLQGRILLYSEFTKKKIADQKIVVYGCGYWGKVTIEELQYYDVEIVCIVDKKLEGQVYRDYPIININELEKYNFSDIVIGSMDFADEIEEILVDYAKKNKKEFCIHRIIPR